MMDAVSLLAQAETPVVPMLLSVFCWTVIYVSISSQNRPRSPLVLRKERRLEAVDQRQYCVVADDFRGMIGNCGDE